VEAPSLVLPSASCESPFRSAVDLAGHPTRLVRAHPSQDAKYLQRTEFFSLRSICPSVAPSAGRLSEVPTTEPATWRTSAGLRNDSIHDRPSVQFSSARPARWQASAISTSAACGYVSTRLRAYSPKDRMCVDGGSWGNESDKHHPALRLQRNAGVKRPLPCCRWGSWRTGATRLTYILHLTCITRVRGLG